MSHCCTYVVVCWYLLGNRSRGRQRRLWTDDIIE